MLCLTPNPKSRGFGMGLEAHFSAAADAVAAMDSSSILFSSFSSIFFLWLTASCSFKLKIVGVSQAAADLET